MSRLRIHVEPVGAMPTRLEVGQLQRARHRSRPLLTGCGSFEHGLALADVEPEPRPGGLRLRCRNHHDAHLAAALARRALDALSPLRELLDEPDDQISVQGSIVRIRSAFPSYVVHRLLGSAKALPDVIPNSAADTVEFLEYSGPDAIAAFERGDLQATAPTSFEIARACSADARFRHCELDVFALLLVGSRRPDRRRIMRGRGVLRERLAAEPGLAGQIFVPVADDTTGPSSTGPAGQPRGDEGAELYYADFWPNETIAGSLSAGLGELGVPARPCPVPLGELHERTASGAFDLALVLANGYAGPHLSVPLTLARSAAVGGARPAGLRDALIDALEGPEDGPAWSALTAAALASVPAIPLGRFNGGSLMDPALPDYPPAYGCVLALEHYAGGCGA